METGSYDVNVLPRDVLPRDVQPPSGGETAAGPSRQEVSVW